MSLSERRYKIIIITDDKEYLCDATNLSSCDARETRSRLALITLAQRPVCPGPTPEKHRVARSLSLLRSSWKQLLHIYMSDIPEISVSLFVRFFPSSFLFSAF